ncbi:beta-glucosidase [Actinoplanes cyaneus]|uniref:beta-glucosidase n=1 Tax=Actinoplanes cyaneus TaxID=52696 RepID=A0A919M9E9_9ACTN|nr:glycoside hydrolase family 3 N-terminal domain-containing protein [Actinoplanes cyaneus]MCW2142362.1 beta-glucosidase [Actinoplanes cyaneus]GID69383.1 beta-glucosidase [Actinoplanes cyaneus]
MTRTIVSISIAVALAAGMSLNALPAAAHGTHQPVLGSRSTPILKIGKLSFRDLDRNAKLTPYEDWRLSAKARATDLLSRMSLEQKAGLLVHGTLPTSGTGYDLARLGPLAADRHITTFITRLTAGPAQLAAANNSVQELAERQPLGIPAVISTDPRNGFSVTEGQTVSRVGVTAMPDAIGQGAAGDPALTRRLADIVRQEYRAVGITEGLSPQADLATEPRWTRIDGTFGSDPQNVRRQVQAYVEGLQNGSDGLGSRSVATVTKHWVGYGAQENGYDSHYYYGRYATFPGSAFATHIVPYLGAFDADTAGIMPTYSILKDLVYKGTTVPQVGAGFNSYLLKDLLRGRYGFDGVIVSDWGITGDCPQQCRDNRPPSSFIGPWGVGMPWGTEDLTVVQRFALSINAGVDQIGGSDVPANVVAAVGQGLLSTARVNQAAHRVLTQKFQLGLFENPYVSPEAATRIAGNPDFQAVGDKAQAASLTLLTNRAGLLPAKRKKTTRVYAYGLDPVALRDRGLTPVTNPADADLTIVRLTDPRGGADLTGLDFTGAEPDYRALQAAADAGVPTVAVPKLNRPLILTDVVDRADAVLANYGVSDEVLLETIFGERAPGGRLPFELPSSTRAVEAQKADVPDDSMAPLFTRGYGLTYPRGRH